MKSIVNKEEEFELENQVYELGYLLVPVLNEEAVSAKALALRDLISDMKGEFISEDTPKMIPLAYKMLKVFKNKRNTFEDAYFGWIKFDMPKDKILELKKKLDLDPEIIRFLIIKTVRENTIATKKVFNRDFSKRKIQVEKEDVVINKEEIDKEIDALIVE